MRRFFLRGLIRRSARFFRRARRRAGQARGSGAAASRAENIP